jgi:hypothetical protein
VDGTPYLYHSILQHRNGQMWRCESSTHLVLDRRSGLAYSVGLSTNFRPFNPIPITPR